MTSSDSTMAARLRIVEEHVGLENARSRWHHGDIRRSGATTTSHGARIIGAARRFAPSTAIAARHARPAHRRPAPARGRRRHRPRGDHSRAAFGAWRGLRHGPADRVSLCGIYTFDDDNRLAGERIYYDRATVLRQLGVFHEPESLRGRIATVLAHPFTMARIAARKTCGSASPVRTLTKRRRAASPSSARRPGDGHRTPSL